MRPLFYKQYQNHEINAEVFKMKWEHLLKRYGTVNIWLPEGFFEDSFLKLIKINLDFVGNFKLHTKNYWEVAELFKNNQIDIAAIDSGAYLPNLDGIINTWKVNKLPGFAHAIDDLIHQLKN
ncbi:MAG: hypothetical protein H6625_03480 [Bdellovibrionaceae bacterium]|nr:hypothetical protein [Pseudobdellovibrionaceae bacterium]